MEPGINDINGYSWNGFSLFSKLSVYQGVRHSLFSNTNSNQWFSSFELFCNISGVCYKYESEMPIPDDVKKMFRFLLLWLFETRTVGTNPPVSRIKTFSIHKISQKIDEFSIRCSVSLEKLYEELSANIFRLSAEFSAPPTLQNNREPCKGEWVDEVNESISPTHASPAPTPTPYIHIHTHLHYNDQLIKETDRNILITAQFHLKNRSANKFKGRTRSVYWKHQEHSKISKKSNEKETTFLDGEMNKSVCSPWYYG